MPPGLLFFFGAGASASLGIPISRDFYDEFLKSSLHLEASQNSDFPLKFDNAIRSSNINPLDVEAVMSVLSALSTPDREDALRRGGKPTTAFLVNRDADQVRFGNNREQASDLLQRLKQFIRDRCESYEVAKLQANYDAVFDAFSNNSLAWFAGHGPGRHSIPFDYMVTPGDPRVLPPFWCFTTNYDCTLEAYFQGRQLDVDLGFKRVGTQSFLDAYEIHHPDKRHKLVKLHGSVDMIGVGRSKVIQAPFFRTGRRTAYGQEVREEILIYPTQEKELFRFPFIDFYFEFASALRAADLWIFVGFSFSDLPILNLILTEATERKKIVIASPHASQYLRGEGGKLASVASLCKLCAVDSGVNSSQFKTSLQAQSSE